MFSKCELFNFNRKIKLIGVFIGNGKVLHKCKLLLLYLS